MVTLSWGAFVAQREARRAAALRAAARLLQGDPLAPAEVLAGWSWIHEPGLLRRVASSLCEALPCPPASILAAHLAPGELLAAPQPAPGGRAALSHHLWIVGQCEHDPQLHAAVDPGSEQERAAWGLSVLAWVAEQIEVARRTPWLEADYPPDPQRDRRAAQMWASWIAGDFFAHRDVWERTFLPLAMRAFNAVFDAGRLPAGRQALVRRELQETFLFFLLGDGSHTPPWRELASSVLETGPAGPLDALEGALGERELARVALCAVSRGHGAVSARLAFPDRTTRAARASALQQVVASGGLRRFVDLHICCRLLDRWRVPEQTHWPATWSVVLQNRGRARGRLRAVLAEAPVSVIAGPLLSLEALHARTCAGVLRYSRDWAWQQLELDFSFGMGRPVLAPCQQPAPPPPGFDEDAQDALRTWVLKVIAKGRLEHLRRWGTRGGTGDRDTQWGRLLTEDLPDLLRDPPGARGRGYEALRAYLHGQLDAILDELDPTLQDLAALDPGRRDLSRAFEGIVSAGWDARVPRLKVRFRSYLEHIQAALSTLSNEGNEPC